MLLRPTELLALSIECYCSEVLMRVLLHQDQYFWKIEVIKLMNLDNDGTCMD